MTDMAGAGRKALVLLCGLTCLLAGCAAPERGKTLADAVLTEVKAAGVDRETEENEDSRELLKAMMKLPGMKDEETAGLLGGGEENWTEDRSFYIGRIYEVELYGQDCRVFTTCGGGPDRVVESVSIWIVNGEREVTEDETLLWLDRISDVMDLKHICEYESVESGARSWKWRKEGMAASMYRMKDILTVSFQPAVGELG